MFRIRVFVFELPLILLSNHMRNEWKTINWVEVFKLRFIFDSHRIYNQISVRFCLAMIRACVLIFKTKSCELRYTSVRNWVEGILDSAWQYARPKVRYYRIDVWLYCCVLGIFSTLWFAVACKPTVNQPIRQIERKLATTFNGSCPSGMQSQLFS